MKFNTELSKSVFYSKYLLEGETEAIQAVERLDKSISKYDEGLKGKILDNVRNLYFLPGGGIWRAAGNPSRKISYVNCTTLEPVEDNLESIFESLYWWAKFAAYGQGEGIDISKLRPRGALVSNTARTSSGGVSFMDLYDATLGVIAQHGRRGASLISINDRYPDFIEFCTKKLGKGIESANISIQASDDFFVAVNNNFSWDLVWEGKEKIVKTEMAKKLFDVMIDSMWRSGEPGVLFMDTIRRESNSDALGYPVVSTNACSEVPSDPHNTCILGSINLAKLREYSLSEMVEFGVRFLDAVVAAEYLENRSPSKLQRDKLMSLTRIGLGVTGLADLLVKENIIYGSSKSFEYVDNLFKTIAEVAYKTSYNLGKAKGCFLKYNKNNYKKSDYVKRLLDYGVIKSKELDYQRHVCKLSIAPTGTLSIIANTGGSGIEPMYAKYMVRRERATSGDWKEWFDFNPIVKDYLISKGLEVTKENADNISDKVFMTAHTLNPESKIELISTIQKWVDQGISVTFNLPKTASKSDVQNLVQLAWVNKLKGIAVYREGSREGVLITEENYDKTKNYKKRVVDKRPKSLPGKVFQENGFTVVVGYKDGKPYEIFGGVLHDVKLSDGDIVKDGSKVYKLCGVNLLEVFNDMQINLVTRFVSLNLRHNIELQFVVDILEKESTFVDVNRFFARVLKRHLTDEEVLSEHKVCGNCKKNTLKYDNGCAVCIECGWSACC